MCNIEERSACLNKEKNQKKL